jgi:DNA (cytosine-5)-methyltransferase 1
MSSARWRVVGYREDNIKYISVCSGIEAATVAWHPLGCEPAFYSEIEPFPSAVLKHHYPRVPNLGDMTKFKEWPDATINVLVGGTPCQSFSVAGLRKGLDDPRGNLMLTYIAIANRYRPKWVVWENVPGVLSSNGGRDFASLLRGLEECGYGVAYRVLDAQYFGVPQRRRRVFVVGHLGSWQRAAAVLFERHSLQGHTPPSRKKGERVATTVTNGPPFSRTGNERVECEAMVVAHHTTGSGYWQEGLGTLRAREQDSHENLVCMSTGQAGAEIGIGIGTTLNCNHEAPIVIHGTQDPCISDIAFDQGRNNGQENVVAFTQNQCGDVLTGYISPSMGTNQNATGRNTPKVMTHMQVRRLTPVECERLQGFPDNYTKIPWRGKDADNCPDGPRYKALGNSMAVPVMQWIGKRIQMVDDLV